MSRSGCPSSASDAAASRMKPSWNGRHWSGPRRLLSGSQECWIAIARFASANARVIAGFAAMLAAPSLMRARTRLQQSMLRSAWGRYRSGREPMAAACASSHSPYAAGSCWSASARTWGGASASHSADSGWQSDRPRSESKTAWPFALVEGTDVWGIQVVATIAAVPASSPSSHRAEHVCPVANSSAVLWSRSTERSSSSTTARLDGRATSSVAPAGRTSRSTWKSVAASAARRPPSLGTGA